MPYRLNAITGDFDLVMDGGSLGAITQIDTDSGSVLPAAGIVNLLGDMTQGVSTSGAGNTANITLADATESQKGVVELATDAEAVAGTASTNLAIIPSSLAAKLGSQTQYALAIGNTTSGALNWTNAGTDGQIPIAATGADPAFASLTSSGGTITFTPGANTLNLEAGATVPTTFQTDSGNAVPSGNILKIFGGTLLGTTGAGNTVTVNADDNVVGSVDTDGSAATPTGNAFTIAGGNNCTTSGAGAVVTIDVDGNVADSFPTDSGTAIPSSGALTISGSGGITTSGAGSTVTVDGSAFQQFTWNETTVTGPTSMAVNNGYIANNAATVGFTLPATASVGDIIRVTGKGAGGWSIAQNAGQTVHFGSSDTTTGVGGSLASTDAQDTVELLCITANTDFNVLSSIGNVTVA